jgi:hypothetical protein
MDKISKWLVLIGGILTVVALLPHAADGQPGRTTRRRSDWTPQLVLATLTWSEAGLVCRNVDRDDDRSLPPGLECQTDDMRAIHATILRGAEIRDWSYVQFAWNYAPHVIGGRGSIAREWLRELDPSGRQPPSWPLTVMRRRGDRIRSEPHAPWSAFRARFLRHYEIAGEIVALTLDTHSEWSPCSEAPDDWGGEMDRERAERLRLIELECGDTDNDYYRRPSRVTDTAP